MACFLPFNSKNLKICFFLFRPTVVPVDDLVHSLKHFCLHTLSLGCLRSTIFKSIHGNMIIWCGAWVKGSDENMEILNEALLSMLANLSSKAVLIDHGFFEAYAGESSGGGSPAAAVFSTGDIISMSAAVPSANDDLNNLSYACLALFKSCFGKMEGVSAGVCLICQNRPRVACLYVWKSLHSCYSWILNTDRRTTMQPYIEHLSPDIKYDIFRVVYVSSENYMFNLQFFPPHFMLENGGESDELTSKARLSMKML